MMRIRQSENSTKMKELAAEFFYKRNISYAIENKVQPFLLHEIKQYTKKTVKCFNVSRAHVTRSDLGNAHRRFFTQAGSKLFCAMKVYKFR